MSSGTDSGQAKGTQGSQLSADNYEYAEKLAEIISGSTIGKLTDSQKSSLATLTNIVNQHLTDMDYSGVERDLAGNPVPNGKGGFFDHIHEMTDSYKGLIKIRKSLEGSLNNPNLGHRERELLENSLKLTNYHINKIDILFKNYGGILKWKKK